jgi:hypothetical protein
MVRTSTSRIWALAALLLALFGCQPGAPASDAGKADAGVHVVGVGSPVFPMTVNGTSVGNAPGLVFPSCSAGQAYGPVDGGAGLQCVSAGGGGGFDGSAGALTNVNPPGLVQDLNSIVMGDVSQAEWQSVPSFAGDAPLLQPNAGTTVDGYGDATWVNPTGIASWYLENEFSAISGATSFQLQVDAKLPMGVGSSTINVMLYQGSSLSTVACTLTSSWQTCETTSVTPTAGIVEAVIYPSSSAAQALIGKVRVVPTATTIPSLTQPFVRYNASPRLLWDNIHDEMINELAAGIPVRLESPYSRFVFWTNASAIAVQAFNAQGTAPYGNIAVYVNGREQCTLSPQYQYFDVDSCSLPSGLNLVEVWTGAMQVYGTTVQPYYTASEGSYVLGVYVPQSAYFQVVPPPTNNDRVLLLGDSKEGGFDASNPPVTGVDAVLRRDTPAASWLVEAWGSISLWQMFSTPAVASATISRLSMAHPTKILQVLGRNDWALTKYGSVTAFQAAYTWANDALHAAIPNATFYVATWALESSGNEAITNGNGELNSVYRTGVRNYAASRPWVTLVDIANAPNYSTSTMLAADGVHPNDLGAGFVGNYIWTSMYSGNPGPSYWGGLCPNNTSCVFAQTAAGTGEIVVFGSDNSNDVLIGSVNNPAQTLIGGPTVQIEDGAGNSLSLGGSNLLFNGQDFEFSNYGYAPLIYQAAYGTDGVPNNLTIQASSAYASAVTNRTGGNLVLSPGSGATTNGTPGNVVVGLSAPTGSGADPFLQVFEGSNRAMSAGYSTANARAQFWVGTSAPTTSNYSITGDGASYTYINSPGALAMLSGGSFFVEYWPAAPSLFYGGTTAGTANEYLDIEAAAEFHFGVADTSAAIVVDAKASDVAPITFTIQGQSAYSAASTNKTGGDLALSGGLGQSSAGFGGAVNVVTGFRIHPLTITNTYTIDTNSTSSDGFLLLNLSAAKTITLPAHNATNTGRYICAKDISGTISTNNATFARAGGTGNIDGVAASYVFGTNYGKICFYDDGSAWWLL